MTLLTIVPQVIAYGILAILHAANPDHHGPAGGVANLGNGMSVLILLGGVAAIIVGAACGADDVNSGVFRELVVTGRSRVALFGARIPGGLLFLLPFVAVGVHALGVRQRPRERLPAGALDDAARRVRDLGARERRVLLRHRARPRIGDRSRAYTIGILIAWRTIVSHIISAIGALGAFREVVPDIGFVRLAPDAVARYVNDGPTDIHPSLAAAVAVPLLWLVVAIARRRVANRDPRRLTRQRAVQPRSSTTGVPVNPRPLGPSRNATTSATSLGSSSRFTACRSRITSSSTRSSGSPCARAWSAICASTSGVRT